MRKVIAALMVTLAVSLAACSSNTVEAPAPADSQASAPAQEPAKTQAPTQGTVAAFGGSVTFPSGVKVSVAKPEVIPGGQYAYGAVEGKITVLTVTVTNGSDQPLNASLMGYPRVTYGDGGTAASNANNEAVGMSSLSTILPGETQTTKVGYGVPAAKVGSIRVEVMSPNLTGLPAVFKASP